MKTIRKINRLSYGPGTFFEQKGGSDLHMLAQVAAGKFLLINLVTGNRYWNESVTDYKLLQNSFTKVDVEIA